MSSANAFSWNQSKILSSDKESGFIETSSNTTFLNKLQTENKNLSVLHKTRSENMVTTSKSVHYKYDIQGFQRKLSIFCREKRMSPFAMAIINPLQKFVKLGFKLTSSNLHASNLPTR